MVQSAHLRLHTSRSGWRQRYFLIEQDDTYGRDPYESLKISHDNLVRMGYADWFWLTASLLVCFRLRMEPPADWTNATGGKISITTKMR